MNRGTNPLTLSYRTLVRDWQNICGLLQEAVTNTNQRRAPTKIVVSLLEFVLA